MTQQLNDKRNDGDFTSGSTSASIIYKKISTMADRLFQTRIGQTVMDVTDRLLLIVEETTKWSLPQDNTEVKLVRPLPWMLFFILIIWLRVLRFCLSICAIMVGSQMITPQIFLFFIQTQRQKIQNKRQSVEIQKNKQEKLCLRRRLSMILSYIICRPGYIIDEPPTTAEMLLTKFHDNSDVSGNSEQLSEMELDTTSSDNLTTKEMIEKFCNKSTDSDDEDFIVNSKEWEKAEDTSTTSTENNEIGNHSNNTHTELEISEEELNDLKRNTYFKNTTETSIPLAANKNCQKGKDDGPLSLNITPPKFIIDECPNTAASIAASNPINNIENNKANNKAVVSKSNVVAEEKVKGTSGRESSATMKTSCYLSTITQLPVSPHFEYHSSYEKIVSNCTPSHDVILTNLKNIECVLDNRTTITTSIPTTTNSTSTSTMTTNITIENASSTEDLYYSPIGSPYPTFCNNLNTFNSNENSLIEASSTPTISNFNSVDNVDSENKKQELPESSQSNDNAASHKKLSFKPSNSNHHTTKHHNHNKNRAKHHYYY